MADESLGSAYVEIGVELSGFAKKMAYVRRESMKQGKLAGAAYNAAFSKQFRAMPAAYQAAALRNIQRFSDRFATRVGTTKFQSSQSAIAASQAAAKAAAKQAAQAAAISAQRYTRLSQTLGTVRSAFLRAATSTTHFGTSLLRTAVSGVSTLSRSLLRLLNPLNLLPNSIRGFIMAWVGFRSIQAIIHNITESVSQFAELEMRMARLGVIAEATTAQIRRAESMIRILGSTTMYTAVEIAEAAERFVVAGFSMQDAMTALPTTIGLAMAESLDLAQATDIAVKIMNGMKLTAGQVADAVDMLGKASVISATTIVELGDSFKYLGPVAAAAGAEMSQVAAAISVLANAGIRGQMAGRTLRMIFVRLQAQPGKVGKELEKWGIQVADAFGNLKPLDKIVDEFNLKLGKLNSMQRQGAIATIVGAEAFAAMNELLLQGGDKLRAFMSEIKGSSGFISNFSAKVLTTLGGSMKVLASIINSARISFGEVLAPVVRNLVYALQEIVPTLGAVAQKVKPVAEIMGVMLANSLRRLSDWLVKNSTLFTSWGDKIAQIVFNVSSRFSQLREVISTVAVKLAEMFGVKLDATDAFGDLLTWIERITSHMELGFEAAWLKFKQLAVDAFRSLIPLTDGLLERIVSKFKPSNLLNVFRYNAAVDRQGTIATDLQNARNRKEEKERSLRRTDLGVAGRWIAEHDVKALTSQIADLEQALQAQITEVQRLEKLLGPSFAGSLHELSVDLGKQYEAVMKRLEGTSGAARAEREAAIIKSVADLLYSRPEHALAIASRDSTYADRIREELGTRGGGFSSKATMENLTGLLSLRPHLKEGLLGLSNREDWKSVVNDAELQATAMRAAIAVGGMSPLAAIMGMVGVGAAAEKKKVAGAAAEIAGSPNMKGVGEQMGISQYLAKVQSSLFENMEGKMKDIADSTEEAADTLESIDDGVAALPAAFASAVAGALGVLPA